MALSDFSLICNFPKCRTKLGGFAWATACSHIFCDQHGSGEFSRTPAICPACSSTLAGKLDIVRTELSPSEQYKAMVLVGLRPEIVLDISHRALAFWTYQVCTVFKFHQPGLMYSHKILMTHIESLTTWYTWHAPGKPRKAADGVQFVSGWDTSRPDREGDGTAEANQRAWDSCFERGDYIPKQGY